MKKNFRKSNLHFDDILFQPMYMFKIKSSSTDIVTNDPRFCSVEVLDAFLKFLENNIVESLSQISILYFENNQQQCIDNLNNNKNISKYIIDSKSKSIISLSKKYNETIDKINTIKMSNIIELPVLNHFLENNATIIQRIFRKHSFWKSSFECPNGIRYLNSKKSWLQMLM